MLRKSLIAIILLLVAFGCSRDPQVALQKLISTGNKYFENGKFKEASIIYRRALQKDRRYGEAYYRLALSEQQMGRIPQAVEAFRRAVELQPENQDAYGHLADLYLAIYLHDPSHPAQILEDLQSLTEQAEQHFPQSFDISRVKGLVALTQKDFPQAVEYLRIAHDQKPDDERVTLGLLESMFNSGDKDQALQMAHDLIESHPNFAPVYDFLYLYHMRQQQYDEALAILTRKIEHNPRDLTSRLQLARHHLLVRDRPAMLKALQSILDEPDLFNDPYSAVGAFYVRIREFDQAVDTFRLGSEQVPARSADYRNKLAEVMAMQGRNEEAFRVVEDVLAKDAENPTALALRGALRLGSHDPSEIAHAVSDFEAALVKMPDNHFLRYNLGEAYRAQGDYERAIVEYESAIERRPDYLPPRLRLAAVHLLRGDPAKALASAEEVLAIAPNNLQAQLLRANAWVRMGEKERARDTLERIVKANPDAREAIMQLAQLDMADRRYADAEHLYRQIYEANPPDLRGLVGLADIYIAQGKKDEAVGLLEKSLKDYPDHVGLQLSYATTLQTVGMFDRAIAVFQKLLADRPDDGRLLKMVGGAYYSKGDLENASRYLNRASELLQYDPTVTLLLGMIAENQGALQQAGTYYERTIDLNPDNAVALNNLAYILSETTADLDRALTLVQKARSLAPEDPNIADTLGYVYIKKNLPESAIPILSDVVAKNPSIVIWRYHFAMALAQQGDNSRAKQHLETALNNRPTQEERLMIQELLSKVGS